MTKVEYFVLEESPYVPGKYTIRLNFDKFPEMITSGSFNVMPARLLNLTYAQYLRFCRDIVGGELTGKRTMYPIVYFKKNLESLTLVRLLNSRMNLVMWEREHPDWREHQEYLALKEQMKQEKKNANNSR